MLVLGINWALAMGIWMAVRGHAWRHNLEMNRIATMIEVLDHERSQARTRSWSVVLTGWFSLFALQCGPSCVLMAAYMLFRFDHYSGRAGHRAHAH